MHKITDGCIFDGKGQLYISHLPADEEMRELIRETGCGVESIEFSMADSLNRLDNTVDSYRKRLECMGTDDLLIHGPFLDLNPMAFDNLVLDATRLRYEQCYQAAKALGAGKIIYHTCYIPGIYMLIGWADRVVDFYNRFLEGKEGIQILMENVQDPEIDPILEVAERITHPDFGLCLDVGHAHCYSNYSPVEWAGKLGSHVKHVHLHDNDGRSDAHLALGEGTVPFEEALSIVFAHSSDATCTVECSLADSVRKSVYRLEQYGEKER
ncbi:MAG: sugar phosphate isomerase/epimerase [Lachnospiraceae bacterium]|nr:sugar phosphate isomerase/epimerase [Lachnospiraceae bacterium]